MRLGFVAILPIVALTLSGCLGTGNAISLAKAKEIARQCVDSTAAPGMYQMRASRSGYGEVSSSTLTATPLKKFGATDDGAAAINACIAQAEGGLGADTPLPDATAYVPELSVAPTVAPTVHQNHCSAVMVGGSGYCLKADR